MSNFSFPEELNYSMLASMYPSRKSEYRRQPLNTRVFSTAGEDIQLILSEQENSFYNTNILAVNFTVQYTGAPVNSYLIGSGYSHFSRQVWTAISSCTKMETIQNPGQLFNAVMNMTVDANTKQNGEPTMGFANGGYTNYGRSITTNDVIQSYSLPLIGIMNTNKLLPAFISDFQLDLTLDAITNYIVTATDITSALPTGVAITNVEIVCEVLTLEASAMAELLRDYPGIIRMKSSSYLFGSSQLSALDSGVKDIIYSHSLNSLTEFIWWASPSDASDKTYGGVNSNLGSGGYQLIINSMPHPVQPVKCDRVAEAMYQI